MRYLTYLPSMRYLTQTMRYLTQAMCYLTQAMRYLTQAMRYLTSQSPYGTTNFSAEAKGLACPFGSDEAFQAFCPSNSTAQTLVHQETNPVLDFSSSTSQTLA